MKSLYLLVALLLSGCTAFEGVRPDIAAKPVPSRYDEIAHINALRSAFQFLAPGNKGAEGERPTLGCYSGNALKPFRAKSAEGYARGVPEEYASGTEMLCAFYTDLPDEADARNKVLFEYVSAGFSLTDIYCSRFFTVVTASEQNRRFGRSVFSGVDTLMSSILTLSNAGKTAIGITNSGFGLIDTTFEAYDSAYLVAPDMANVRKLVLAAQNEYRANVLEGDRDFPKTYATARSIIERYAGLCTFPGMRQLVNDSISEKTDEIEANVEPNTAAVPATAAADGPETPVGAEDDILTGEDDETPASDAVRDEPATVPVPPG
jgi:hypothetical protein